MNNRWPLFVHRILRYEYWPGWLFYAPVFPYWLYLSLRMRSLTFFTATNPGIELGGFFGESKQAILEQIPDEWLPKQIVVERHQLHVIDALLHKAGLHFPVVAKPDVGERGTGVEKIDALAALKRYLLAATGTVIIQEFINYPEEFGVFYCKVPGEPGGQIVSLTQKRLLSVTGDGQHTVEALLKQSARARFQLPRLRIEQGKRLQEIPAKGVLRIIEPVGNHCRGTEFVNANSMINPAMTELFDRIAAMVPGFYYGRFDIKALSSEALQAGQGICILELNGISSEPGHIYDRNMSLLRAYRDIARCWNRMAVIAKANAHLQHQTVGWWVLVRLYVRHVLMGKPVRGQY